MLFFSFGEHQIVNTVRSPPISASDYWLLPDSDARRGEIIPSPLSAASRMDRGVATSTFR
jgi:hypothetical protein